MKVLLIQPPIEDFYETPIRRQPLGLAYLVPEFINTLTYFMLEVVNLLWHDDNQGGYPCQELAHIVSS
jgi:hypothetical protein